MRRPKPGNRYSETIEGLFAAIAESGVERLPAERRNARRERPYATALL
jgi:hypothetical protein